MTPYVLILQLFLAPGPDWASNVVAIDMPSEEACREALHNWRALRQSGPGQPMRWMGAKPPAGVCAARNGLVVEDKP